MLFSFNNFSSGDNEIMRPSHTKLLEKIKDEIEAGQFTTGGDPKQQRNILRIGKERNSSSFNLLT